MESHYEEKQMNPEGAILLIPGVHEKQNRNDPLYPYLDLVQVPLAEKAKL